MGAISVGVRATTEDAMSEYLEAGDEDRQLFHQCPLAVTLASVRYAMKFLSGRFHRSIPILRSPQASGPGDTAETVKSMSSAVALMTLFCLPAGLILNFCRKKPVIVDSNGALTVLARTSHSNRVVSTAGDSI